MDVKNKAPSSNRLRQFITTLLSVLLLACGGGGGGGGNSQRTPVSPLNTSFSGHISGQFLVPTNTSIQNCSLPSGFAAVGLATVLVQDERFSTLETFETGTCGEFDRVVPSAAKYLSVTKLGYQSLVTSINVVSAQTTTLVSMLPNGANPKFALLGYVWDSRTSSPVKQINFSLIDSIYGKPIFGVDPQLIQISTGGAPTAFNYFSHTSSSQNPASVAIALYETSPICSGNLDPLHGSIFGACDSNKTASINNRFSGISFVAHTLIETKPADDEWSFVDFNQTMRSLMGSVKNINTNQTITLGDSPVGSGFLTNQTLLHIFPDIANPFSAIYQNNYPLASIVAPRTTPVYPANIDLGYFNIYPALKSAEDSPYTTIGIAANLPAAVGTFHRRAVLAIIAGETNPYLLIGLNGLLNNLTRNGTPLVVLDASEENRNDSNLESLSESSGGLYLHIGQNLNQAAAIDRINSVLGFQYSLIPQITYPETLNNRIPDLNIQLLDQSGNVITARHIQIQ